MYALYISVSPSFSTLTGTVLHLSLPVLCLVSLVVDAQLSLGNVLAAFRFSAFCVSSSQQCGWSRIYEWCFLWLVWIYEWFVFLVACLMIASMFDSVINSRLCFFFPPVWCFFSVFFSDLFLYFRCNVNLPFLSFFLLAVFLFINSLTLSRDFSS